MDMSIVQSVHRKLKYYKKKMKVYGRMKHDLKIARKALESIRDHRIDWEFSEDMTDGYIDRGGLATDALREMKGDKS